MMKLHRIGRRGFTLLELSIVIAIISLIAGVGIKMSSDALKAADRISTQERLNTIKTAIDSFAKTYGYLPCPAQRNVLPSSALFGIEGRDGTTHNSCIAAITHNGTVYFGAVPVRTLGLPDNYAGDAWSNKFDYAVGDALVQSQTALSTQNAAITVRFGDRTNWYVQSSQRSTLTGGTGSINATKLRVTYGSTGTLTTAKLAYITSVDYNGTYTPSAVGATTVDFSSITYTNPDTGAVTISWQEPGANASYVVVSHGPDGRGAWPLNGTAIPATRLCNTSATAGSSPAPCTDNTNTVCIDIENCNDDSTFFDATYNDGTQASSYFDDYIVWGSNDLMRTPVSNTLYTSCPVGICENWCATCTVNYPGATATVPPALTNPFLYKKVITSNSSTCTATCFWGGTNAAVTYSKGP